MTGMENTATKEELRRLLRDYVAYVLTSARGLYREPASYGPMRMVDAMEKSVALMRELGLADEELDETLTVIRENRWRAMDPEGFSQALDEAIHLLVRSTLKESEGEEA
ncbi:DUF6092 family protein [Brevibacillus sp. B_LB10_24]|uniref:DUF6092 family protein n=1 Tax=Brevibacillus sp. B_LB10_24 TaxID=3380645 RepID=UPI0038BB0E3E